MIITQDDFTWMFKDPDWKNKFLVGSLLALASFMVPLVGLAGLAICYGYALILMRATLRGEPRALPKWEDMGKLLVDGVMAGLSSLGYLLPGLLFLIGGMVLAYVTIFAGAIATGLAEESQRSAPPVLPFVAGQLMFLLSFAGGMLLYLPGMLVLPVGIGQYVRTGDVGSGYRWREVWQILRANPGGFVVAWLVYWGLSMVLSIAASLLYFTIVLCLFVPFLVAPIRFYLALQFAQLFGQAYREGARRAGLFNSPAPLPAVTT